MRKIIIITLLFLIIIISSTVGYKVVSANTKIPEIDNIITYQETKENYLTPYNYTIDNPNIVLNPYGNSPLTALIIFETKTEESVTITVPGKDNLSTYTNTFTKTKTHYIPVFGLYPDYENKITIKCGTTTKTYTIKTDPLPTDMTITKKENNTNNLYFITTDNYTYAIDNNNDVRWYLTSKYQHKISRLTNGHLLLSNDTLNDDKKPTGLVEIDLLGKVYNEYNIGDSYYGSYAETEKSIFILSKNLLEIDKQSGIILKEIKLNDTYTNLSYNKDTNTLTLKNDTTILNITNNKKTSQPNPNQNLTKETEILLPLYNINTYELTKGNIFTNTKETKESNKNIALLNYKKTDAAYDSHNITITKEDTRLVINSTFTNNEEAYLILDKFLDKKIYDLKSGYNYINSKGLSGDYSIYIKINKKIYKTNNYVTF